MVEPGETLAPYVDPLGAGLRFTSVYLMSPYGTKLASVCNESCSITLRSSHQPDRNTESETVQMLVIDRRSSKGLLKDICEHCKLVQATKRMSAQCI